MVEGFHSAGFETRFGDPGFILGLPYASTHFQLAQFAGRMIIPWVVRLPFSWLYPTGKKQEENRPRFQSWFDWADVIADDFHYIRRHLPLKIANKIIVTNTTTPADRKLLRQRGARYLVTTTPLLDGRSYGTNVFEAALTAAAGKSRSLTHAELSDAVREIGFQPNVVRLN
jgi:hypothetical protein